MNTLRRLFGTSLLTILWFALAGTAATTTTEAANAPVSIIGKKFAFTYQSNDGDSGVAHFFAKTASDVWEYDGDDGEWESDHYQWQASGNTATFKEEELEITLSFSSASGGSFTFVDYDDESALTGQREIASEGTGTFVITNFSQNEIPFDRYFNDDFSDQTTTRSNWAKGHNDSQYGLTLNQDQGNYSLTGTFNGDPDDRWLYLGAQSLLPLDKDWTVEGEPFATIEGNAQFEARLVVMVESSAVEYFDLAVGISNWSRAMANFYYEIQEQSSGESYPTTLNASKYRIRNISTEKKFLCEFLEGSSWKTILTFNWQTGTYTNHQGVTQQVSQWVSLEGQHVQPVMSFTVPHEDNAGAITFSNIGNNQLGFSSFSIAAGAGGDGQDGNANPGTGQDGALDWQDYDDFSGGGLDAEKWEVGYFSGGQTAVEANGMIELKGGAYTGSDPTVLPQDLLPAAQDSTEGNAFLFAQQEGMLGIEAEITLPSSGNTVEAGVFIDMFDSSPLGSSGIELAYRPSGVNFSYDYLDAAGQEVEGEKAAARDTKYQVAVVHSEGKTTFYVDGEKIQEFDQSFTPDYWGIGAFNDNGQPFTAYVDNVRVLTTAADGTGDGTGQDGQDFAPDTLIGKNVRYQETQLDANGNKTPWGWDEATFSEIHVTKWDDDDKAYKKEPYTYEKISKSEGRIRVEEEGETYEMNLVFSDYSHATGTWTEKDDEGTWSGTIEFEIVQETTDNQTGENNETTGGPSYAPEHLDGWTLRFEIDAGDGKDVDVVEFRQNEATEKDEDGDSDFEQTTPYTVDKTAPDTLVIRLSGTDGANSPQDVYTLNFVTGETGDGRLDDYAIHNNGAPDNTFEATETPGLYKDLIGSGPFTFSVLSRPQGDHNGSGEEHHKPESEGLPTSQVRDFVDTWIGDKDHYEGAKVMWAEKHHDLADDDNFVYEVGLDNGVALFFDKNNTFLHSAHDNEFADHDVEVLKPDEIPGDVKEAIKGVHPDAKILEVEKEFSREPPAEGQGKAFIYLAIIEKDGKEFEVALGSDAKVHHTHRHEKSDFEEWKPVEFPAAATTHLLGNDYKDGDHEIPYWVEERARPDGTMEFVAHLDDDRLVVFDANGSLLEERDLIKERLEQVDAGLKFDANRSTWGATGAFVKDGDANPARTNGQDQGENAFVHIKRVEKEADGNATGDPTHHHQGNDGMLYRIALLNRAVTDGNATAADLNLAGTDLPAGTKLNLTFTYEMGPPRYFVVSGANLTEFKHRRPEWDKPGSFTIEVETVDPVASQNNLQDSISSTFGILVEMGGERFREGATLVTNVISKDVKGPDLSSPWDAVAGFRLNGLAEANASVSAYLPKRLLQHHFDIWEQDDVSAAIARDDDGNFSLSYIAGSRREGEGGEGDVGGAFARTPFKGVEPADFAGTAPEADQEDGEVAKSFIDFDGDGFVDSMLKVSFKNNSWPGEVQIGDPWLDPWSNVNLDDFGSISGTVSDINDKPLKEFGIWIGKAPEDNGTEAPHDAHETDHVFFDLRIEANGTYVAKVPPGRYYVEAHAYDPETDTGYKPQLAGGRENPRIFDVADANTSLAQNFSLEAEYRVSHEWGEVNGTVTSNDEPVEGVAIELYPVENGAVQTDYPVHVLFVEHEGKIRGKAPVGTFRGEVVSWDNAYLDKNVSITIVANPLNNLGEITLAKRALATVTGRITDANGTSIWADVLFVDPEDEDEVTWPAEFHISPDADGNFTAKVPTGSYKILAQRFDGTVIPAYHLAGEGNTAEFSEAATVDVNASGVTGIDFVLQSRPTATVHVQVVDANTSAPVKYAWFLFHDAEDEEGGVIFPEVRSVNPFESNDFNGSYVIKVPGGTYKVEVEADGYEPAFRILNDSGTGAWHHTDWENGAPVTLTDGNESTLERASLKAFEKSEAERFGFAWMDHDDEGGEGGGSLPAGNSISGKVKTKDGTVVPKARIVAHTADYLLWLDHVTTRSDGSYELKNLPARDDWVVFAEPPFDSEAFRGFRESNATRVNLKDSNETVDLELQSSNVYGKILFPRKDRETGETRNAPLAHAHVWAFQDDDGDGEPDFDFDEAGTTDESREKLIEAFGETDKKGVFSFYLPKAGKYSLQIDLPGRLSALRPEPITFNVRNPDQDLKLGNAIKIEWKTKTKATSFDIGRKASTESTYRSIFASDEDKPAGKAKSFVDVSVTPGETYKYQVTAETANGKQALESNEVKASNPIIYLSPPKKTITGYVFDDSNNTVSGAEVVAWREEGEGWSSILTESDGSFELVAGPGKWEVTVYRPHDVKVDWIYEKQPKRVGFKKDSTKESKSVNFTVSKAAGGKVTGSVKLPDGQSSWADVYQYVSVDAFDHEGRGNWADLAADGTFEIPLQPGNYEVAVWVAPELKGFGSSEIKFVRIGKETVDLGEFVLDAREAKIEGVVKTDDGKFLPNVEVWAWSEKGGWVSDVTNVNGAYSLAVSPGRWEVGFELPQAEDGSAPPYLHEPPKRVRVFKDKPTPKIDFTARSAKASVKGMVYGPSGKPVTDVDAWAYARLAKSDEDDFDEIVADVPVDSRGQFGFPGVPGEYYVGLWLPPGSGYVIPAEQLLTLDKDGVLQDANEATLDEIVFKLEANDAVVTGSLKLSGSAVTGLSGEVYAARGNGGGWQSAPIEDNGTYTLTLSPGRWMLGYFIESDDEDRNLPPHPPEPIEVKALKGQSVTQDFTLRSADATISGTIVDENGTQITEPVFVWAYREATGNLDEFWTEVETEANGSYTLPVLPGGEYEVGVFLPDDIREKGYLEPAEASVDLSSTPPALSLALGKIKDENYIEGTITDDQGNKLEEAFVYAWSDDGRVIEGETNADGTYKLKVPKGVVWHVGADYGETDDNGSETIYFAEVELDADLRNADTKSGLNLTLKEPDFEVPAGASDSFDPSKDFVVKLPDGTEVTIPGGAANVSSDETSVRAVVTPTAKGLTKTANDQPTSYAYSIELFDSTGKKVEGNFKKDVILKIPVDQNATLAKGLDPNNLEAKFYSTTKNSWDTLKSSTFDKNASVIYATTDHFTSVAVVSNADVSDLAEGLSKVDPTNSGDWYSLDWFGNFYDASSGWVYHETHGWLYTADAGSGNFWFYDADLGWFWTGSSYYDESSTTQAEYLYSSTHAQWLYFTTDNGKRKFYRYSDTKWINADGTDFSQ